MKLITRRDYWGVVATLVAMLLATALLWSYEKRQQFNRGQAAFEQISDTVTRDLRDTMRAYGLFLRGGVSFFRSSDEVTRADWHDYVSNLDFAANYPGVLGVSYGVVLRDRSQLDRFSRYIDATDWPGYTIKPDGPRDLYAPLLYVEPMNPMTEQALGFDIYSEPNRRAAIDAAISTGNPTMTAKIQLISENPSNGAETVQAGTIVILPVFTNDLPTLSPTARLAATQGLIISAFRMGDLVEAILAKQGIDVQGLLAASLYDAPSVTPEETMFEDVRLANGGLLDAKYTSTQTFDVFGRTWTFQTVSTPEFETTISTMGSKLIAIAGVLFSLLLTSGVYGQVVRAHDSMITADKLSKNRDQIQLLMAEVNHRSKNLLSLVQAIARQTSKSESREFVNNFALRLRALSASQDLLVKNEWRKISLSTLVLSQLAYFEGLVGERIFIEGPEVALDAPAAQTIGMAIYELATNAGKYGSLSNQDGEVRILWTIEDSTFNMSWVETGGPTITPPNDLGFGSRVTGTVAEMSLDAIVKTDFAPSGLRWHLKCSTSNLSKPVQVA
ncbi:MAG: CHASE domain-containing protein [Planktomarina sp.]